MRRKIDKKLEQLEAELNRCLQEKEACDTKLHDLEREQFGLVRTSTTEANQSFHGEDVTGDFDEMVHKNEEIQKTVQSMGKVLRDINKLVDTMRGTYMPKKASKTSGIEQENSLDTDALAKALNQLDENVEEESQGFDQITENTDSHQETEHDNDESASESDTGSSIADLLSSPAVLRLIPSLVKALSK